MNNPPTMSQFADQISCLEARDKYWREENAELRKQLASVIAECNNEKGRTRRWKERAEAAEAWIKTAEEQDPVGRL